MSGKTKAEAPIAEELASRLPGLEGLWTITRGRPEVVIAVLDGPVEFKSVPGTKIVPSGGVEHGTHVYSIIAGSSDAVVPGIAPLCTLASIPICGPASSQVDQVCTQEELAAGITRALDQNANIVNISASQQADLLALSTDLSKALQDAAARDVLVVAAAGNQGCACDALPASVPGVLAVGAHDADGIPLRSSNWGPNQRTQGIVAPGVHVPGACVGGGLCRASGTSFAAALVSGVAGLLMSADVQHGLKPSGGRIRKILLESCARPANQVEMASTYLSGRLDVGAAVALLIGSNATTNAREEPLAITASLESNVSPQHAASDCDANGASAEPAPQLWRSPGRGLVPADCGCVCGGAATDCACNGAKAKPQLVYAIGRIGVSFVSQARRDSMWRIVNGKTSGELKPITDASLQDLFKKQPFQAQSVVWTLSRTEVPMYVIVPAGPFAAETYKWLVEEWSDATVEFVSIPGVLAGQVALYDGQIVDAVIPDLRGMYSWETKKYVKALKDASKKADAGASEAKIEREINRFLGKIYFSIRNRGLAPQERALNSAATNAFNVSPVIVEAGEDGMTLRDVAVERSPLNRPGSEYFDVLLTFFDPQHRQERAPLRARFTIDVSDTVPVMIGDAVTWHEY